MEYIDSRLSDADISQIKMVFKEFVKTSRESIYFLQLSHDLEKMHTAVVTAK